jgi:hypothetical protein
MTKIEKILEEIAYRRSTAQDSLEGYDPGEEDWLLQLEITCAQIAVLDEVYQLVKEIGLEPD